MKRILTIFANKIIHQYGILGKKNTAVYVQEIKFDLLSGIYRIFCTPVYQPLSTIQFYRLVQHFPFRVLYVFEPSYPYGRYGGSNKQNCNVLLH